MSEPIVFKLDNLPMEIKKDKVGYVSYCPALDIYSQGESEEEAISMLAEAIEMFIKSCFDRGVLFQVLEDCGWRDETNYSIDFKISMADYDKTALV